MCIACTEHGDVVVFVTHKLSSTYYVFTAGNQRDEFCGDCTAQEREQSDNWNGQPYGQYRVSNIAVNNPLGYERQEEDVHQIHAKGELGKAVNPSGSLLDAAEQQEGAKGGKQYVGGAELP